MTEMPDPSDGMTYPNRPEEMQDVEMQPAVVGPGAYASPDPDTEAGRLLPLDEHPLSESISEDYGQDVSGAEAKAPADMTVAELDAKYGNEPDYPADANKDEKVSFAEDVEEERAESADEEASEDDEIGNMTVAELDEQYGDEEGYPSDGKKPEKVQFARDYEESN